MIEQQMPFTVTADALGRVVFRGTTTSVFGIRVREVSVETTGNCRGRSHPTRIVINGEERTATIRDCEVFTDTRDVTVPAGEVRGEFVCEGFDPNEVISGLLTVTYGIILDDSFSHLSPEQRVILSRVFSRSPQRATTTVETERTFSTYRKNLGTHDLPNGSRGCWKHGVDTRSEWITVWADMSHPQLDDFINDAIDCAIGAATGTLIVAVATGIGAAAAIATFKAAFYACLAAKIGQRAHETEITVDSSTEHGDWSGH